MKNFTLLLSAALLMGATASAAGLNQKTVNPTMLVKTEKTVNAHDFNIKNTPREIDVTKLTTQRPAFSRAAEDIIENPQGQAQQYMATTYAWEYSWFGLMLGESNNLTEVVWGDNDQVYIKNILNIGLDHYIKGTLVDGKIRVDFPQTIYYSEGEYDGEMVVDEYYYTIFDLEVVTDEEDGSQLLNYVPTSPEENYAIYNVGEDGVITLELSDWEESDDMYDDYNLLPGKIIALCLNETYMGQTADGWAGFGVIHQSLEIFDKQHVDLPEGVESSKWVMTYKDSYGDEAALYVDVAIDGDKVYMGGFDEDIPGWAVGTIDGDKVTFASEQYLGYMDLYSTTMYFMTAYITEEVVVDEDGWEWTNPVAEWTEGITFKYDAEAQRMEATDDTTIVLNGNTEYLYMLDMFTAPTIYVQDPALVNAAPETPEMYSFVAWDPDLYGGQGEMVWYIPAINVNGEILDTDRMYYHILFDGEVEPLSEDVYPYVEGEIWDIPYDYSEGYDIFPSGAYHDIWFYADGVETFGCQSFFVGSDGVTYASEIGVYVDSETGIDGVKDFSKVLSTTYFDLSGRQVTSPEAGIYIKSMKLANGKVLNVKVSIK